ncbi:3-oxo-tetronate kinase [Vibrio cyclitrophicus]|uniref:3-oxo-tetronate kinase n=1 Tax=Vibrio cyclitrophicus TaxID=47951 RepID=UPI0011B550D6|nr:3-oxo-tetronate kinase [Vibrio cyclitrophicus]
MTSKPILGVIADDFTGASDIASFLFKGGLNPIQINSLEEDIPLGPEMDTLVIALKTRTLPVELAVEQSLAAVRYLQRQGCQFFYFKYCSTFDSLPTGNIGPVIDVLLNELELHQAICCPALPANGRTVYQGHLFVNDLLLENSSLKDHPLTPMNQSRLADLLAPQVSAQYQHDMANLTIQDLAKSEMADYLLNARYIICDCIEQRHFSQIIEHISQHNTPLFTGGSGLGQYMGDYLIRKEVIGHNVNTHPFVTTGNKTLIIAGSCSQATRKQLERVDHLPKFCVDPYALVNGELSVGDVLDWIETQQSTVVVYSSQDPHKLKTTQQELGRERIASEIESLFSQLAVNTSFKNIIVAGGETSGAVVSALNIASLKVGPSICPGVPLMQSNDDNGITLALKSGNFGDDDFFHNAIELIKRYSEVKHAN